MDVVRKVFAPSVLSGGEQQAVELALQEIGLSQLETMLYRAALSLGPRPASILAKSLKIQRTRVYDLLSSLQSRGLIEIVERNCARHFAATSPDRLMSLVRDRKKHVDTQLDLLERTIPALFADSQWLAAGVASKTVRGARLVREALTETLNTNHHSLLAIGDIESILEMNEGMSRWATQFRASRVSRGISLRISVQGPPDLQTDEAILREILSSPDIPEGVLALATNDTVFFIEESAPIQATRMESETFCRILHGFYNSWLQSVQRVV